MVKKGEIVSLAIIIILGLVVSSFVTGSGPYEKYFTGSGDFEPDNGDMGDASGAMKAGVLMGYYGPDGEPVKSQSSGLQLVRAGKVEHVSYFKAQVDWVTIEADKVQFDTVKVTVKAYIDYIGDGRQRSENFKTISRTYGAFVVVRESTTRGDPGYTKWIAQGGTKRSSGAAEFLSGSMVQYSLVMYGDILGISYKRDGFNWKSRLVIECTATDNYGEPIKATFEETLTLKTDWEVSDPYLRVSGGVRAMGFIPTDTAGLSVTFVILSIFVGIWYKWGRTLIPWT